MRTLHARMAIHERNAGELAQWLQGRPGVRRVFYPGLAAHPGHEVARRQQAGFGAMLTLELEGGTEAVRGFVEGLELFSLAESLGGVESLVAHPATMTHAAMDPAARAAAGLTDGLVRLSEGQLEVTPRGRLFVRNVAMAFDAYLQRPPVPGARRAPTYSRTV